MTLRAKIILWSLGGIGVIIAVYAVVLLVTSFLPKNSALETPSNQNILPTGAAGDTGSLPTGTAPQNTTGTTGTVTTQTPTMQAPQGSEADLIALVFPFIERFGSYSNQSNYEHLEALLPFMTDTMKEQAQKDIQKQRSSPLPTIYKGYTTKALAYSFTSMKDSGLTGDAVVKVSTQRQESAGGTSNTKVYNQDASVTLKKENGIWLVSNVEWK